MDWTNERVEELRRLWGQGQTASRIADLLGGVTRNAVIGKAHRLGLRGRPSPIRREEGAPPRAAAPRVSIPAPQPVKVELAPVETSREAPRSAPIAAPAAAAAPKTAGVGGLRSCSWPMGDPKQPGFHFCGEEAVPGRPYCATHCGMAYQRKSEAAA